jgi:superfamily II DNA or RNA helicase
MSSLAPLEQPSPADALPKLWAQYRRLPMPIRDIIRLKSLLLTPTNKTPFLDCAARAGLLTPDGKAWTPQTLNPILDDLVRKALLTDTLACAPELRHAVTAETMASADGATMAEAVDQVFPVPAARGSYYSHSTQHDPDFVRALRLSIYRNDDAAFTAATACYDRDFRPEYGRHLLEELFLNERLDPAWLGTLEPGIQSAIFLTKLDGFLASGIPAADLAELIGHYRGMQDRAGFEAVRGALLTHDLLAGNLEDARRKIESLEDPDGYTGVMLQASADFLSGRNEQAIQHYREALKRYRKHAGKRKVFFAGSNGLYFIMALLRADDAALHAEIQAGVDVATSVSTPFQGGFRALQALLWLSQGLEDKARAWLQHQRFDLAGEPLSAACVALAEFCIDSQLARKRRNDLAQRFGQLQDCLPLVARIYAELLAEVADQPEPYRTFLTDTRLATDVTFTALIEIRPPWQRSLESLSGLLAASAAKPAAAPAARKAKRLAWFIDPASCAVAVVEQSAVGKESWSDGRPVAMKRLHEQDPRLTYLTEQDRRILRTIRKDMGGWSGDDQYSFDPVRTIPALVGHPALFDMNKRAEPIELVAYPAELVVSEVKKGFTVRLSHSAKALAVFLEAETPSRYRVIQFSAQALAVQEILGRTGLTVPKAAYDQIVALVRQENPKLPIRSEIAAIGLPALAGDPRPVLQLRPQGEGFGVSLVVRPFGSEGPAYVAGLGGRSVLAAIDGRQQRANRDLERERAALDELIAACPTLRDRVAPGSHAAEIDDLETSLELLGELDAHRQDIAIEWPEGRRLTVSAITNDQVKFKISSGRDWFGIAGSVAVAEDQVLEMRFLLDRLTRAAGRFIPLDDGRFVALTRQLQAQLQRLADLTEPDRGGLRLPKAAAASIGDLLDEAGAVEGDAAWQNQLARFREAENLTPVPPATLQADLRDYQLEGFEWLSRLARWGAGACLADDMGLGKTIQALAVMLDLAAGGPCLVVAPTSVCPNWAAEIRRFAPTLAVHGLAGTADRAALIAKLGPRDVLIVSYGLLHQEAATLSAKPWRMAVLDEAQAIKNAESKRAQASLGLEAWFRLALTGTPIENYLDEVWSLFNFINPGLLGGREGFQRRFAVPIERDRDPHKRQALKALIRPFILRRTKAAVLSELPPRIEQTMAIEMGDEERAFYEMLRRKAVETIETLDAEPGRRKLHILAEITKLRRACCNPILIDPASGIPSAKLEAFCDLVDDLIRNRHRPLVFSQFVGHLGLVGAALDRRAIDYQYLDGATPMAERARRVAEFQAGAGELFLISLKAGGTGLNLTAADFVIHLDPWWNPAVEDQASDRAHRIGQERSVTIYRLVMKDSIEERILGLHRDKRQLATDLLEGTETGARLSEEQLLDLIRL